MKNLLKKTLLTAILLTFLSSISLSQNSVEDYVGSVTGDDVRLRASASTKADILGKTQAADMLVVVAEKGDWLKIQLPEYITVWVSRKYVQADKSSQVGIVSGDNVNIRMVANTSKTVLGKLNKGDKVEIVGVKNDFMQIVPPVQATGWISAKYVKKLGAVHKYLLQLKQERNKNLKRAAAKFEADNQSAIAKAYLNLVKKIDKPAVEENTEKEAYEKEKNKFDELMMKFTQCNFNPDSANLETLKALSYEIKAFKDGCTSEIKTGALQLWDNLQLKIKNIEKFRADKVEADRIAAEKKIADEKKQAALEKVKDKLLRVNNQEFIAVGVVVDQKGNQADPIFYLADGGAIKFRLALSMISKVNLRDYWHKNVGIKGKIIYDEDEEFPIVICNEMVVLGE